MSKAPICSCGNSMVERRNKVTGQKFYGCAKFAKGGCGETADHEEEDSTTFGDIYNTTGGFY